MARSNITRTVTRAQEQAEREHNAGEARVCGGCRNYGGINNNGYCAVALPFWVLTTSGRFMPPDTDATECEAYEQK